MSLPKIKLAVLGRLPPDFDLRDIANWQSSVFEIDPHIESYELNEDPEGDDWEYTDQQLEKYLATNSDGSFLIILLSVKLQHNWYVRRLTNNRILFSFYELDQILRFHHIPLKNIALRVLYAAFLIYRRYSNRIPPASESTNYAHNETRGCLFDMNASKIDVIHSCDEPIICDYCITQLKTMQVSNEAIKLVQTEIKKIRKPLFHRIADFVRNHPVWSMLISLFIALIIGTVASLIAAFMYESIRSAI